MFKRIISLFALLGGLALAPQAALAKPGQEQACASHMADQVNEPMSSVRVESSNPFIMGSRQMTLTTPGMRATCTADVHNLVVYFEFLAPR